MVKTSIKLNDNEKKFLEDLALSQKSVQKTIRNYSLVCLAVALVGVILFVWVKSAFWIFYAALFVILALSIRPLFRNRIRKSWKKIDPRMMEAERFYEIDETGIRITTSFSDGKTGWDGFVDYGTGGNYIWLRRVDTQTVLLDRSKLTPEEIAEVEGYLKKISVKA